MRTLLTAALLAAGCATPEAPPRAETTAGVVQGVRDGSVTHFAGIPFAAPPVGDLRWRAPQPVARWDGVRKSTRTPACAQGTNRKDVSEDCLYLHVTARDGAEDRPVLVWLHGGGFSEGAGFDYDPARMASRGDVVVVTVDFRLGLYGFFGAPGLDGSGTFGFQDQQAALRWVRDNIRGFGGDPGNVTLAGESGGAIATCAHLTSPGARGLVHRAILQSGWCDGGVPANLTPTGSAAFRFFQPRATVEKTGAETMTALGCDSVACLREVPPARLDEHYPKFGAGAYGTAILPTDPIEAEIAPVPMIVGANRHEHRLTAGIMALAGFEWRTEDFPRLMTETFGDGAPAIVREYDPATFGGNAALAWAQVFTDSAACASSGAGGPAFAYDFADENAQPFIDLPEGFPAGASHASELPNLFEVAGRQPITSDRYTDAQRRLADTMIDYWTTFARTGDPNHEGAPSWARGATLQLAPDDIRPVDPDAVHRCDFWRSTEDTDTLGR